MKRYLPIIVFVVFLFVLVPSQRGRAQHGNPLPLPADAWKGQVTGKVVNGTSSKTVTEPLDVMLHAWDSENQERMMVHGKAEPDGTFIFEDVDFHQSFFYSVMATYLGATYFSQTANVEKGLTSLTLDARVYDTTNDLSTIKIDQLHVLFFIKDGQFGVTQFYLLSNSGQRTVKDAVTLPRDRTATLKFHLPDEAQNVKFGNDSSGSRYVLLPGGFSDTAPIPPGEGTSQVVVGYDLPFTGNLVYNYLAQAPIKELSFLVLEGSGLSLEEIDLIPAGDRTLQDGTKFNVFTAPSLKPGESVQLTVIGQPQGETTGNTTATQTSSSNGLRIGAVVLGLSLLGGGVWWWRRSKAEESIELSPEDNLIELEQLDEDHARGEVPEQEY